MSGLEAAQTKNIVTDSRNLSVSPGEYIRAWPCDFHAPGVRERRRVTIPRPIELRTLAVVGADAANAA